MRVEFEGWVYDGECRQLLHGSEPVPLSPKAFDLLGALIARRPAAVSKAELKDLLWPETFVADANLPSLIAEIRTRLDDDARRSRFVRTVQRFGYAFCGQARIGAARANANRNASGVEAGGPAACHLVGGGRELALTEGETVLGRSREAAGFITSGSVSRRHASIVVKDGHATIADLDSKNGTFVAGRRIIGPTVLEDGVAVRLGTVKLTFRAAGETSTLTVRRLRRD